MTSKVWGGLTPLFWLPLLFPMTLECQRKGPDVTEQRHRTEAPTLSSLAHETGITFPPSARLVGAARESGIDDLVRFKVELNSGDLPAFLAKSPVPPDAFEPGEGGLLGPDEGFWNPSRAAHLRTGQVIRKPQRALNIGIDDGPQVVVLYIVEHGT